MQSEKIGIKLWIVFGFYLLSGGLLVPAFGQEVEKLIRIIDAQQREIETLTADFTQKKETRIVKKPLLSSGVVKFKRPDQIYWHYTKPESMEVAFSGKGVWIYYPGSFQAEKYKLGKNSRVTQSLEPLLAIFQNPFSQLSAGYTMIYEGLDAGRLHHFRLQPRDAKVQKFLSGVDLRIDKTSGAIIRFIMIEANGDRLNLEFKNLLINPPLTDDDLKIKIPPSVKVME
jgi:outer membrane lipoprotein carrier protein